MKPLKLLILGAFLFLFANSPSQAQTVYITKTGAKYHTGDCRYLHSSKIAISLKEARKEYSPCSVCKPSSGGDGTIQRTVDKPTYAPSKSSESTQCTARTQSGSRCKRMTTNMSGRCWQHE